MLILTVGFSSVSLLLGIDFFRKYSTRLNMHLHGRYYSRVADYHGRPILLRFDYQMEDGNNWVAVEAEVDEIFHYGPDYFLRGSIANSKSARLYRRNRIANLRMDTIGSELESVKRLLIETAEMGSRAAA